MSINTDHNLPLAVVVCGPTGIGKTAFAIELARRFKGEIIGADSMQLYRRMDIGTAKPTPAEKAAVTHHMVDIIDPDGHFDAEIYADSAYATVLALTGKGILPFIVGGTGLYIKALIHGLFEGVTVDADVRQRLKKEAEERGGPSLHARLKAVDPAAAHRIHANDTYRIESIDGDALYVAVFTPRYQELNVNYTISWRLILENEYAAVAPWC